MKTFTALSLVLTFFVAGAHVFVLFTSPYYLVLKEYIILVFAVGIMLFSLVGFIAIVEPHKHVEKIISYIYIAMFLLILISSEFLVKVIHELL